MECHAPVMAIWKWWEDSHAPVMATVKLVTLVVPVVLAGLVAVGRPGCHNQAQLKVIVRQLVGTVSDRSTLVNKASVDVREVKGNELLIEGAATNISGEIHLEVPRGIHLEVEATHTHGACEARGKARLLISDDTAACTIILRPFEEGLT